MSTIQPVRDLLVVKPVEASREGFLFIPEDATAKMQKGEVIAVGPWLSFDDDESQPPPEPVYKVGDIILYSVYGANELRDDGRKLFIVPEKEVFAKVS
jgi:co-chaperonin GroES (HSP10)